MQRQGLLRDALHLTERAALISPLDPFLQMDLAHRKLSVGLENEALALAAAIDATIAPPSGELEHYVLYDSVREHPDFQAQLTRAKTRETEIRAQLTAEKLRLDFCWWRPRSDYLISSRS